MEDKNCTVVFCLCGCGKLVYAALNTELGTPDVKRSLSAYRAKGCTIETATSDFVRNNWNSHKGPIPDKGKTVKMPARQGNLFE